MVFRPTITDYIATLENPAGVFRTLFSDRDGVVFEPVFERDLYGELRFRAGNAAAVFTYFRDGRRRFLKLYVRPNPYLREIYDYVEWVHREKRTGAPILPRVRLLRDELFVLSANGPSGIVDVVEGEWVEGKTLADTNCVAQPAAARDRLAAAFDKLCAELRASEWAHGDLKPENIVVSMDEIPRRPSISLGTTGGTPSPRLGMTLVDCDAMWIPAFGEHTADYPTGRPAVELGTPPWADPDRLAARSAARFDKSIDDHPMARIAEWLRTP